MSFLSLATSFSLPFSRWMQFCRPASLWPTAIFLRQVGGFACLKVGSDRRWLVWARLPHTPSGGSGFVREVRGCVDRIASGWFGLVPCGRLEAVWTTVRGCPSFLLMSHPLLWPLGSTTRNLHLHDEQLSLLKKPNSSEFRFYDEFMTKKQFAKEVASYLNFRDEPRNSS
jgi:hypothetical protein